MDVVYLMKREMLRRGLSRRTIETYCGCVGVFLRKCNKEPRKVAISDVRGYLDSLIDKGVSGSTINVNLNAIKFMMENVLNKKFFANVKFSKTPKKIPVCLSKEEVMRLFSVVKNQKHLLILKLLYSTGLRVSEMLNLRVKDLELDEGFGWVRGGKGNKDRMFVIAKSIVGELRELVHSKDNDSLLFIGINGRLSTRSVYQIVKTAAIDAKIRKKVHPHTLRHSFATHLVQNGDDIITVQNLLGHNDTKTTMVYLHTARKNMLDVKSPLDKLS